MEDKQEPDRTQSGFDDQPNEPIFEEPVFDEPVIDEPAFDEPVFDEPVFEEPQGGESLADEPVFDEPFDEPVFDDALPDQPGVEQAGGPVVEPVAGASPPVQATSNAAPAAPHSGSAASVSIDEYAPFDELDAAKTATAGPRRRLGRTGPFWIMIVALAAVIVLAIALPDGEQTPSVDNTPAVAGAPIAAATEPAVVASPTPAPTPTFTPIPLLAPGQRVVVGNTDGQGIRLRGSPGLNGLTLAIYDDGQPFEVLEPGSEYAAYPVEVDGYRWYRLRVADDPTDQLVGWAAGDFLIIDSQQ